ncbi:putative transcriptional regulator ycf27 (fragment) [Desulfamplus magnetovallimortis]|uniref:Putative transcriptional regulator ycf27 n=1 Tax=Desulfamplus magnetovallimortis TaxID=1246637 RepID=A0A1W1H731_9BACT
MKKNRTILIVDDMRQIRNILRFSLKKEGFDVVTADSGQAALDYAFSPVKPLDLVLLDIMMPKMDGYEVIKRLKKDDRTKNIPVIFLTAKAQVKDVVNGKAMGADDYVVKPYKFGVLHQKILDLLNIA